MDQERLVSKVSPELRMRSSRIIMDNRVLIREHFGIPVPPSTLSDSLSPPTYPPT